jgi:hypothetical protein
MNASLQALASLNSGGDAPDTTYANMLWYDSGTNILKMRSENNDAWINVGTLDQGANTFQASYTPPFTPVQQGGGAGQGSNKVYIGWDGSGLKAQVDSSDEGRLTFQSQTFGIGQSWQGVSRSLNTSYLNNTGKPIHVSAARGGMPMYFEVSSNNSSWLRVASAEISGGAMVITHSVIVPNNWYYRVVGGSGNPDVKELR